MNATAGSIHATEAQAPASVSSTQAKAADPYDLSPRARRIVSFVLLAGIVFLGSIAAYVYYGFQLWKQIP